MTYAAIRDAIFGPHKRVKRQETFTPRHSLSEWWCILWHRLGVRCQAHALGLEAYYQVYNARKVDEWKPQVNGKRGL